jgi:hypothetical protein
MLGLAEMAWKLAWGCTSEKQPPSMAFLYPRKELRYPYQFTAETTSHEYYRIIDALTTIIDQTEFTYSKPLFSSHSYFSSLNGRFYVSRAYEDGTATNLFL